MTAKTKYPTRPPKTGEAIIKSHPLGELRRLVKEAVTEALDERERKESEKAK